MVEASLRNGLIHGLVFTLLLGGCGRCFAEDPDLKVLLERMERMEKQNEELKQRLDQQQEIITRQQQILQALQPAQPPANTPTLVPALNQVAAQVAQPVPEPNDNPVLGQFAQGPGGPPPSSGGGSIFNPSPNPGGGGIAAGSFPYGTDGARSRFEAGWTDQDGFFLRSGNNQFFMRITGQIQADYRGYDISHDTTDLDSFLVRRARLGVEGVVFNSWEYRLLPDFSNSQSNTTDLATPRILDAYINAHYWDEFQVEAGKFKQPFSYEQLVQDRFIPTVERSLIDQLVPARDIGVMVHGEKLFADTFDYAFSVFNGEINDDYDQNNGKNLAARVVVRPLNFPSLPDYLRGWQLGLSYSWGRDNETVSNTTPNTIRMPDQVPFLVFNSAIRDEGIRTRVSPEIVYFNGPLGFATQYYYGQQRFLPSASAPLFVTVPESGFYVMSSYVLTGEKRTTYSQTVVPFNDFDPRHPFIHPGAVELIARVSELRFGNDIFESFKVGKTTYGPLANESLYSQGATEFDIGFNWFLNKYIRVEFAYEHDWFLEGVQLGAGPGGNVKNQDAILTRLQLAF
jgi:phosphate-selective porin OprO and OprP